MSTLNESRTPVIAPKSAATAPTSAYSAPVSKASGKSSHSSVGQLDDLLNMIDSLEDSSTPAASSTTSKPRPLVAASSGSSSAVAPLTKCFPPTLCGSVPDGAKRACTNLLCTKCDFSVVKIDNYAWTDDCDYMFFRNNTPDVRKLLVNAESSRGTAAYCCQCSWTTVRTACNVPADIRWACAGHSLK